MPDKPVVFLAFANDREGRAGYLRNLPEEARRLAGALEGARQGGLCEVVVRANVTLEELFGVFQSAEYRDRVAVLHYGGHAEGYGLLLEGEGGVAAAHGAGLAELLGTQRGLRLVFLNGCATEPQAQGLLDAGVSAVLVTSQAIDDGVALAFAGHFYAGLGGGASLSTAYAEAKAAVTARRGEGVARGVGLYRPEVQALAERWPWALLPKPGAERALDWSLPKAAGDPLFGIPEVARGDLPESPYRHLQPFGRAHAELFFGRGEAIRTLYERVTGADSPPLILLYGRSGVGKSSLLEAGLLARLEPSHTLCYRRREPARGLWGSVLGCLGEGLDGAGARARWRQREAEAGKPLLIVLDQVEEIYTRPNPNRPEELAECLDALQQLLADPSARPQGKLIFGFRQEWLPELEQALAERELPRSAVYLQPLDRRGLFEAIIGPSRSPRLRQRYGLRIEDGLAETIADMLLADPEAPLAPTLQILLAKLWAAARGKDPARPHFDSPLFRALKREGLLLGDYLDQQLAAIADQHAEAVRSGLVLDLLAYHTTARGTAEGRPKEVLRAAYAHCPDLAALLASCQGGYLLLPGPEGGTRLGHDTLAPLVRERFEESDRAGQRARRVLESRALEWGEERQGALLDEADLAIVEAGQAGMRVWTESEQRLIAASRRARDKRARQRKVYRTLGLMAIVAVALSMAVTTWQWQQAERRGLEARAAQQAAEEQRTAAEAARGLAELRERQAEKEKAVAKRQSQLSRARQLAAESMLALTASPMELVKGTLLAAESLKHMQTTEGSRAWAQAMALLPRKVVGLKHEGDVDRLAFSPDGSVLGMLMNLGSREAHGWVRVLDTNSGTMSAEIHHEGSVSDMAFSPDGRLLATVSWDHALILTDAAKGERLYRVLNDAPVLSLAFSSDGHRLAIGGQDGSVCVKQAATGADVLCVRHEAPVIGLAFTPEGNRLVTGSEDKTARVWDAKTARELHRLDHATKLTVMGLNRDGSHLATVAEEDSAVRIWDIASGELVLRLEHDAPAHDAVFSPDGAWIVTGARDHTARIWDARTGAERHRLAHRDRIVRVVGVSPNAKYLATVNGWWEDEAIIWSTETGEELFRAEHDESVMWVDFAADSRTFATSTDKGALWLWDMASREPIKRLKQNGNVNHLSFGPDGQRLAAAILKGPTTKGSGNVYGDQHSWGAGLLWDPDSGTIRQRFGDQPRHLTDMAFSPNGALLATGGYGGTVRLWDVESGTEKTQLQQEGRVDSVKFTPEHRLIASSATKASVWDPNTAQSLFNFSEAGGVSSLQVSADGRRVLTVGSNEEKTVRVWSTETGEELYRLASTSGVLSPNGRFVAHVHEDRETLEVIDLDGDKGKTRLSDGSTVKQHTMDPEGKRLAILYEDNRIAVWDVAVQAVSARITHSDAPRGPNVASVKFSADGQLLASQGYDTAVRVWEASTGTLVSQLVSEIPMGLPYFSFSNDGRRIVTVSLNPKVIRLWDTRSGEILHEIAWEHVSALPVFSPDDSRLVFGHRDGLEVWDTSSWKRLLVVSHDVPQKAVLSVAFTPDGGRIATGGWDGTARVWDAATGEELLRLQHDDWVTQLAFSANGALLVTRDNLHGLGTARAWNLSTGKERFRFAHGGVWQRTAHNRSGSHVVTANGAMARVWSTRSGQKVAEFRHDADVELMSLSSDGQRLATVQRGYSPSGLPAVRLWDVASGRELVQLQHERGVQALSFSRDDTRLLTAAGGTARIWDVETGRESARFTLDADIRHMILSEDEALLAASYDGGSEAEKGVAVWDARETRLLARLPHYEKDSRVVLVDFQPGGTTLATADHGALVRIWNPLSAHPELLRLDHEDSVFDVVMSPDSTRLAAQINVAEHNYAPIWDLATGQELYRVVHDGPVWDVAMSPDGQRLATGSSDGTARVWDAADGRELARLPHDNKVHRVKFSPDSRWLATYIGGIESGTLNQWEEDRLRVWDAASGQAAGLAINGFIMDFDFSPAGNLMVTGEGTFGQFSNDRRLGFFGFRIWDVATGEERLRIPTERPIDFVAFAPNGETIATLATAYYGEPVRLWDTKTGVLVREVVDFGAEQKDSVRSVVLDAGWAYLAAKRNEYLKEVQVWNVVTGNKEADLVHDDHVGYMAFSPDGRHLAAQSGDAVSVWDWRRSRKLIELHLGSSIYDLKFTPDGSRIVTAGHGGLVQVWLWKREDLVSDACACLERNLTADEWRTYLGDEPREPTCLELPMD